MTEAQETALVLHIKNLEAVGGSVSIAKPQAVANIIIMEAANGVDPLPKPVSHMWTGRLLRRHPEVAAVVQKPLEVARMMAQKPHKVEEYFEDLQALMMKWGVGKDDLWNMNETGFSVGMDGKRKIITFAASKKAKHYLASELDRESVTNRGHQRGWKGDPTFHHLQSQNTSLAILLQRTRELRSLHHQ
jgi:hypothetical protein